MKMCCSLSLLCAWKSSSWTFRDSWSTMWSGGQRMGAWDWLQHNIRYNKPLIWWSICSRTSSSIIQPPVRHHHGSGAVQEPDRVNSFLHVHDLVRVHSSTCLSLVTALQTWRFSKSPHDTALDVWDDMFYLTFKPGDETERSVLFSELDQFLLPVHMCFLLCGCFLGFFLLCQHMLCIRPYVLQFITLYFVPLSGLLIASILSLKCNYVHHVMFLVEIHLQARIVGLAKLPSTENKNIL